MNVVRTLHRTPHRYAVSRISDGDCTVVLDVELLLRACFVFTFDNQVRVGPGVVNIPFIDQKLFEDVVLTPDDRFFRERIFEGEDRRLLFDLDANVSTRFFKQVFVVMSEQQDGLFRMIYKIRSEIRLIVENQSNIVSARDIFCGDYSELIPWDVAFERNVFDSSTRRRTADRNAVKHLGKRQIVHIQRLAGDFLAAFFTGK